LCYQVRENVCMNNSEPIKQPHNASELSLPLCVSLPVGGLVQHTAVELPGDSRAVPGDSRAMPGNSRAMPVDNRVIIPSNQYLNVQEKTGEM
jgi:hypothetical protein